MCVCVYVYIGSVIGRKQIRSFRVRDKRQRPVIYYVCIVTADRTCDQLLTVAKRDTGTAVVAFEYK